MKELLATLVALLVLPVVLGADSTTPITPDPLGPGNDEPEVFLAERFFDIGIDIDGSGSTINPSDIRGANYAFTGEKIIYHVLVRDSNGAEDINIVRWVKEEGDPPEPKVQGGPCEEIPVGECYGTPEEGTCSNYNYEQCMRIDGCNLTCDSYVDNIGDCDGNLPCYTTIQEAVDNASNGSIICVASGTYTECPQIVINKDLTILGENKDTVIIRPLSNTAKPTGGTNPPGDASGWFLVQDGVTANIEGLTLDGSGKNIGIGILTYGSGNIRNNIIKNMSYSDYIGFGVWLWNSDMVVSGNTFSNFERVGVEMKGSETDGTILCNTFICKGDGEWLDYAVELGAGAEGAVSNNEISDCRGVAYDSSTSAGILITTYYGAGTTAAITGNRIHDSYEGIAIGYDSADSSTVTVNGGNDIYDNDVGIATSESSSISLVVNGNNIHGNSVNGIDATNGPSVDAENNYWGCAAGANSSGCDTVSGNVDYDPWSQSEFDIPDCEPQLSPICEGTPESCIIITEEDKCEVETEGCNWLPGEDIPILTNLHYDEQTDKFYRCILTVESQWGGEDPAIYIEAKDLSGDNGSMLPEMWTFNPSLTITLETSDGNPLRFGDVMDDETPTCVTEPNCVRGHFLDGEDQQNRNCTMYECYETGEKLCDIQFSTNKVVLTNNAVVVDLWPFIAATDFYSSNGMAKCPFTNELDANQFEYRATQGTWDSGWRIMPQYSNNTGCSGPTIDDTCRGGCRITTGCPVNELSPGHSIEIALKLVWPTPCIGSFDVGTFYAIVRAV